MGEISDKGWDTIAAIGMCFSFSLAIVGLYFITYLRERNARR